MLNWKNGAYNFLRVNVQMLFTNLWAYDRETEIAAACQEWHSGTSAVWRKWCEHSAIQGIITLAYLGNNFFWCQRHFHCVECFSLFWDVWRWSELTNQVDIFGEFPPAKFSSRRWDARLAGKEVRAIGWPSNWGGFLWLFSPCAVYTTARIDHPIMILSCSGG